jgi:hypothetical protein
MKAKSAVLIVMSTPTIKPPMLMSFSYALANCKPTAAIA